MGHRHVVRAFSILSKFELNIKMHAFSIFWSESAQNIRAQGKERSVRACSYDPDYQDVSLTETNISVRSYGIFRPACRDEITM